MLDNGARWISHDRLKKVYVDPEEDPPPETRQDRDYYPFRQVQRGQQQVTYYRGFPWELAAANCGPSKVYDTVVK